MMVDDPPTGVPFTADLADSVDDWSRALFDTLRSWHVAREGRWTRCEPGYLLLEVELVDGADIDPVMIDTADDELTVTFGYWEAHLPEPFGNGEADAPETAEQAKQLVEDWLAGRVRTAVFTNKEDEWCGSKLVEGDDLLPQLDPDWISSFRPTQVEVRTPYRTAWRRFSIDGNQIVEMI